MLSLTPWFALRWKVGLTTLSSLNCYHFMLLFFGLIGPPGGKGARGDTDGDGRPGEKGEQGEGGIKGPRGDAGRLPPGTEMKDLKGDKG